MEVVLSYITTDFHILIAVQDLIVFKPDWKNRNRGQWKKQGRKQGRREKTKIYPPKFTPRKPSFGRGGRPPPPPPSISRPRCPSLTIPLCAAAFSRPPSSPVSSSRCRLTHVAAIHQRSIAGGTQVTTSSLLDAIAERFEFKHGFSFRFQVSYLSRQERVVRSGARYRW